MKKAITLMLIGLIGFSMNAQNLLESEQLNQINNIDLTNEHLLHSLSTGNPASYISQTNKQRLDSLIIESNDENTMQWNNDEKSIYTYDEQENLTRRDDYNWDENTAQWNPSRSRQSAYNSDGKITLFALLYYTNDGQAFGDKREFTYDANNNLILTLGHELENNEWIPDIKDEYEYDANDNRTLHTKYNWQDSQWMPNDKYEYSYDSNNNQILRINYTWNNNQWILERKYEYSYDSNNNETLILNYDWNVYTEEWIQTSRFEYSYDANNNVILCVNSTWSSFLLSWNPFTKSVFEYDANNYQTLKAEYRWSNDQWVPDSRTEQVYNSNGAEASYLKLRWYATIEQWVGQYKHERNFDMDGNMISLIDYVWDTDSTQWRYNLRNNYNYDYTYTYEELITSLLEVYNQHKCTDYTRDIWDITTGQWMLETGRGTYYYSKQLVGIENIVQAGIQVFPNPADNQVFFDLPPANQPAHIQLYDAQGKIADTQLVSDNKISVEHLNTGIYFYQLFYNDSQYGGTLMVK